MPSKVVKTIQDLIYWEYAKLIAGSTIGSRKNYGFVMYVYKRLKDQKIKPSNILRENKKLFESGKACAYCGSLDNLQWEHIIPRVKVELDTIDNQVLACQPCNNLKSGRDPFEWYGLEKSMKYRELCWENI